MMITHLSTTPIQPRRGACAGALGVLALLAFTVGCGSSRIEVKFTVTSEPEGAFTVFSTTGEATTSDWLYIGNTPLVTVREVDEGQIESARAVTIKAIKQGYFDQTKVWSGKQFMEEIQSKGGIFWNPRLVPSK
jgi:hypothetical protein